MCWAVGWQEMMSTFGKKFMKGISKVIRIMIILPLN